MKKYYQLTELLLKLIKVQIEKYAGLVRMGVGPDAGINARLVFAEVEELLRFAINLLDLIAQQKNDAALFNEVFLQTRFYLDQERLRGYAAWLIDENNIHSTEYLRIQQYGADIQKIVQENDLADLSSAAPQNDSQKQCEHDSHAIAYKITHLVLQLKQDPTMVFDDGIVPHHAQKILRRHAQLEGGRYHKPDIYHQIKQLHDECDGFLQKSPLQTSQDTLSLEEMHSKKHDHVKQFTALLSRFKECCPASVLFSETPNWYKIAVNHPQARRETVQHYPLSGLCPNGLFGSRAVALSIGTLAMLTLIFNLAWGQERQYQFSPSL